MDSATRIIVGVTGASGVVYAKRALEMFGAAGVETHLVISRAAEMTLQYELEMSARDLADLASHRYAIGDVGAPVSSGSFKTIGMLIAPCSVRTMSEIATGVTSSLLTRAADVVLKERRKLVMMVRENTVSSGTFAHHDASWRKWGQLSRRPLPAFYAEPESVDALIDQSVGRTLDLFGIEAPVTKRWGEDLEKGRRTT